MRGRAAILTTHSMEVGNIAVLSILNVLTGG